MSVLMPDGVFIPKFIPKSKDQLNEVVATFEHKKIVKTFVDEDTGDTLYEHIGIGKGGFEWHTGVFVVERGVK